MKHRALALGIVASAVLGCLMMTQKSVVALDFRAFYCAGMAVRNHENPYHTAPLRRCEIGNTDVVYAERFPQTTLPAPQPMYDIAAFSVLSRLPYPEAKVVWGGILAACIFCTIFCLFRLTALPLPIVVAIVLPALSGNVMALGQALPLYTAAVSAAALLMKMDRARLAGAVGALTLIEPHLGLPLCLSLAIWSPGSRWPLAIAAGAFGSVALAAGGVSLNQEYFTTVLPLHALSEVASDAQLSLSVVLVSLHVAAQDAIRIGVLSYLAVSVLAIAFSRIVAAHLGSSAYLVTVPAAAAVLGGSFIHITDIVAALPLAMMLTAIPRIRGLLAIAIVLLTSPWMSFAQPSDMAPWFVVSCVADAYVLWFLAGLDAWASVGVAMLIAVALWQLSAAYERDQRAYSARSFHPVIPIAERYPQASWARANAGVSTQSVPSWLMRAPVWGGLLLVAGATGLAVRPRSGVVAA